MELGVGNSKVSSDTVEVSKKKCETRADSSDSSESTESESDSSSSSESSSTTSVSSKSDEDEKMTSPKASVTVDSITDKLARRAVLSVPAVGPSRATGGRLDENRGNLGNNNSQYEKNRAAIWDNFKPQAGTRTPPAADEHGLYSSGDGRAARVIGRINPDPPTNMHISFSPQDWECGSCPKLPKHGVNNSEIFVLADQSWPPQV